MCTNTYASNKGPGPGPVGIFFRVFIEFEVGPTQLGDRHRPRYICRKADSFD